jgi:hypothetical protein
MTTPAADRRGWLALAGLTLLAAALRFYRLGDWSLSGDESFTLGFSTDAFTWRDLRPLAFAMNHYLAVPLFGANEFAIRFFPALFGVAAVPVVGVLAWRTYGRLTGIFAAVLIAISPGLVGHSQFARYYMQSFTVTAVVPFALLIWIEERRTRWLVIAALCLIAGWFIVPSSSFVMPGLLVWAWVARRDILRDGGLRWLGTHRPLVILAALVMAGGAAYVAYRVRAAYMVDALTEGIRYSSAAQVILGAVAVVGLPVVLLACVGLVLVSADTRLAPPARWLPLCWALGSALTFAAAFPLIAIGPPHVVSVLAVGFLTAGYVLARLWDGSNDHAAAGAAIAALLLPQSRDLASHYVDGNHLDFRGAAHVVSELQQRQPGTVYVLGHANFSHYAPELRAHEFILTPDSLQWVDDSSRREPIRLVLSEHRKGLDVPESDPLMARVLALCTLERRLHRQRFDYYVNAVRVYDCPPPTRPSPPTATP